MIPLQTQEAFRNPLVCIAGKRAHRELEPDLLPSWCLSSAVMTVVADDSQPKKRSSWLQELSFCHHGSRRETEPDVLLRRAMRGSASNPLAHAAGK